MKKTMYKLGFVALLGLGVLSNAQVREGVVGVNTETPQATLDVQPNTTNANGTTNEGIIAPKLNKERVAKIETPVEGTLVYVTDATYSGNKTEVAKIDDKGYYYFDGTEWVKTKGAAAQTVGATNGLSKTGDNIELGGVLTKDTDVNQAGKTFWFKNGKVRIGDYFTGTPIGKLSVQGSVWTNGHFIAENNTTDGASLVLINSSKTAPELVSKWQAYNMNRNGLEGIHFYSYNSQNEFLGDRFSILDNGRVGINKDKPQATLDIRVLDANGTSPEGILIPRVTSERAENMGESVAEATLVYITGGMAGATTTSLVNGKGFYYYDATAKKWQKVGGSKGATLQSLTGGIRKVDQANATEWAKAGTFCLIQTTTATIDMPNPAEYKDKILSVNNQSRTQLNYGGNYTPVSASTLDGGKGHILMSDGEAWYVIGGSY